MEIFRRADMALGLGVGDPWCKAPGGLDPGYYWEFLVPYTFHTSSCPEDRVLTLAQWLSNWGAGMPQPGNLWPHPLKQQGGRFGL